MMLGDEPNMIHELVLGSKRFKLDRTLVMSALNVTPDSFSDGGLYMDPGSALERAKQMVGEGCDIIDVGGESTRPFSSPISVEEELKRIEPVLESIRALEVPVSIDTCKPEVASRALDLGAHMVNDVTGLRDEGMMRLVAERAVPVVVMHMKGSPKSMQENPEYDDVVGEIIGFFESTIERASGMGIKRENIILDPGIGFGKKVEHNLEILGRLGEFRSLGHPILVGTSRKSFIGKLLDVEVNDRLEGSLATLAAAIMNGADIARVHDVRESVRIAKVIDAIKGANKHT
jgi:dihydropteroate synthase